MDWCESSSSSEYSNRVQKDISEKFPKEKSRIARGDCDVSASTSHTQYFRKSSCNRNEFRRITTKEYLGETAEFVSGSSDTFRCVHGVEGKQYTQKELLKRNLIKNLDPFPKNSNSECPPVYGWEIAQKIEFLMKDPVRIQHVDRLQEHLRDFAKISSGGFRIDTLRSLIEILDYLADASIKKVSYYREGFKGLMRNVEKPILLVNSSDVVTYFDMLRNFITFLGYMLLPFEDDDLFELVSKGLLYQLSAPDKHRGPGTVRLRHILAAAKKVMVENVVRMIAIARPNRFPVFLKIALLLACDAQDNCVDFMMANIIENIFYRFNPYFPDRDLPVYDINPCNLDDIGVRLGESSVHMETVLSLLLVLVKTIREFLNEHPEYHKIFPYPDEYAQRCFVWAFRYECRVREHCHQRCSLTSITHMLIHIFGQNLTIFGNILMADIMTLSVLTELPPRNDWTKTVNINTTNEDVKFKKFLIYLSVDFLKIYPFNKFLAESRCWNVALMYLVDPGLSLLKAKWSTLHFAELRKTALQALIISLQLVPPDVSTQLSLIRRTMWYVEWYSELPYDMSVLYWCVRLLQTALHDRTSSNRNSAINELYQTHGVIIILHLCNTLLDQKLPPLERSQTIIGLNLRLLTSCLEFKAKVSCYVYPHLKWPISLNKVVRKMMHIVFYSLEKRTICSDRWMLSLLNFIWEAIIWKKEYREDFTANNGIYQLLDIITMSRYPVQCVALAMICDILREGEAVAQLITWRADMHVSNTEPTLVKPGATIATLLAAICANDCKMQGIHLDHNNVIQDLDFPLMSAACRKYFSSPEFFETKNQRTPHCLSACELAGSRMAKCFAILHMLSQDLKEKVDLADEAYNLYKNIEIKEKDEALLVLLSHYLTIKLDEVWQETQMHSDVFIPIDNDTREEFLHIGRGWAKCIQQQQLNVADKFRKKELGEENNLYAFLERVRLNIALDALHEVRCIARSSDRAHITHALIFDAVRAYHRRSVCANKLAAPVVQTYEPPLDDNNVIGQNIKVINILPKHKPKKREYLKSSAKMMMSHQGVPGLLTEALRTPVGSETSPVKEDQGSKGSQALLSQGSTEIQYSESPKTTTLNVPNTSKNYVQSRTFPPDHL